jgi:thiosulfate/3-mercaptopyruvate sulfurtransferase
MKRGICSCIVAIGWAFLIAVGSAAPYDPVVSTEWIQEHINNRSLIVLDIRKVEEYREGHIPGSISLTFNAWRTTDGKMGCQLPMKDELEDKVCSIGADANSYVVIVGKTDTDVDCVSATRVVWTLRYAGIRNLSILDGGFGKWVREGRPLTEKVTKRAKSDFRCGWNESVLAAKKDVMDSCACKGQDAIVDTRPAAQFTGRIVCPSVKRKGHIPGAINLPYALVHTKEGMFESRETLQALAARKIGEDRERKIIVVCSTGQFASAWWFALSEMLGYKDVKIYDGAMEEWCGDQAAPLETTPGQ